MRPQEELIFWTKYLAEKGLISGSEGNLSVRCKEGFFITPSGKIKETLALRDLAFISFEGKILIGNPSSEWGLHYKIYLKNPQAKAIVHTHPPYVLALERRGFNFREFYHFEGNFLQKILSILPPLSPGSEKMWEFASNLCRCNPLVILARHGVVAWSNTLEKAVNYVLILEKLCQLEYLAQEGGKEK